MNQLRSLSLKHKLIVALCAIVSCFMLSASMLLPPATDARAVDGTTDPAITHELAGVTIAQNNGWVFTDASFDENRYLKLITVSVTYKPIGADDTAPTETVALELTHESAGGGTDSFNTSAKTGEKVTITFDKSAKTMTATVKAVREGAQFAAGTTELASEAVTYTPGTRVVNGISAVYKKPESATVTTKTGLTTLLNYIEVRDAYNDGTADTTGLPFSPSFYKFLDRTHLFPENYEDDIKIENGERVYNKILTIETTSNYSTTSKHTTTVEIVGIQFADPDSVGYYGWLSGTLGAQTARSDLDLSGLSVDVTYSVSGGAPTVMSVPLSSFPIEWCTRTYYTDASDPESIIGTLTVDVQKIALLFKYNQSAESSLQAKGEYIKDTNYTMARISIHTPTFSPLTGQDGNKKTTISWSGTAEIDINNWDYDELYIGEDPEKPQSPQPTVTVYKGATGSDPQELVAGPILPAETGNEVVKLDSSNKSVKVTLPEPACDYKVVVSFGSAERNKDFQWNVANQITGGETQTGYTDVVFLVQVDKGTVNPILQLSTSATDHVYGKDWDKGTVEATIKGTANELTGWTYKATAEESDKTKTEQYYHLEYYTDEACTETKKVDISTLTDENNSNVLRLSAGTYYVKVVTHENSQFYASDDPNHTGTTVAQPLTVTPKPIAANQIIKDRVYDRTNYKGNLTKIVDVAQNVFVYGDADESVPVTITNTAGTTADILHVGEYTLKVTLIGDAATNYTFATDGTTKPSVDDVKFNITKRTLSMSASVTLTDGSSTIENGIPVFTYGDTDVTVTPKIASKTDGGCNSGCTLTGDKHHFYAVPSAVQYYTEANYNKLTSNTDGYKQPDDTLDIDDTDFHKWNVGKYYVFYYTTTDTPTDAAGDYTLPSAAAVFEIKKATSAALSIANPTLIYNANNQDFVITGFDTVYHSYKSIAGETHTSDKQNIAVTTPTTGTISVRNAGVYTAVISIDDNHEWAAGQTGLNEDDNTVTLTFTVNQKEIVIAWYDDDATHKFDVDAMKYPYQANMTEVKPSARATNVCTPSGEGALADVVTLTTKAYVKTGDTFIDENPTDGFKNAGGYWVAVTEIDNANYKLPKVYYASYIIGAAGLKAPELVAQGTADVQFSDKTFTATYKGSVYHILDYMNKEGETAYTSSNVIVAITSTKGDTTIKNATTYTITFTPTDDYLWDGTTEGTDAARTGKQLTFVVTEYTFAMQWEDVDYTYNAGAARHPRAKSDFIFKRNDADDVSLKYEITAGDGINAAANHVVTVSLTGDDKDNYTIDASTTSKTYTIKKAQVTKPTAPTGSFTFGTEKIAQFGASDPYNWAWFANAGGTARVTVSIVHKFPENITGKSYENKFDLSNGQLEWLDAGTYTVTFTLDPDIAKNYCWVGSGNEENFVENPNYTTEVSFNVNRKELTVPTWDAAEGQQHFRIFQWKADAGDKGIKPELSSNLELPNGTTLTGGTVPDYSGGTAWNSFAPTERGCYYFKYTLTGDEQYNYYFADTGWNVGNFGSVLGATTTYPNGVVCTYKDGEVSIAIHYAISSQLLVVDFAFADYTFGTNVEDSNVYDTGIEKTTLENIFKVTTNGNDAETLKTESAREGAFTLTVVYTASNGNIVGGFVYGSGDSAVTGLTKNDLDKVMEDKTLTSDTERNLPWKADTYTAQLFWSFDAAISNYNVTSSSNSYSFTVKPRPIEVDWFSDENDENSKLGSTLTHSLTYDGDPHTLYAKIKNAPVRGSVDSAAGLAFSVKVGGNATQTAANTYTATVVIDKNSAGASNFIVNADFKTATLIIAKRDVTIAAAAVADYVFGNTVPTTNNWTGGDVSNNTGFVKNDKETAKSWLTIAFLQNGVPTTVTDKTSAATTGLQITLVPNTSGDGATLWNNYNLTCAPAAFTINKRAITVSINSDVKPTSVYGSDVYDLNDAGVYTVTLSDGTNNGLPAGVNAGDVFKLKAGGVSSDGMTGKTTGNVSGTYYVSINRLNTTDYDITFAHETDNKVEYEITPAALKVKVDITIYYGEDLPTLVNGGFKMSTGYLTEPKVTGQRNSGIYTIDPKDFVNRDSIGVLTGGYSGTFSYDVYVGDNLAPNEKPTLDKDYTIRLTFNNLTCGNYKFVADINYGKLTVQPLPITVTVKEGLEVTYCESGLAASYLEELNTKDTGYTVTLPDSSYGLTGDKAKVQPLDEYSAIFTLKTDALISGENGTGWTNHVGNWPIDLSINGCSATGNYTVSRAVNDTHTYAVTKATNVFTQSFAFEGGTVLGMTETLTDETAVLNALGNVFAWTYGTFNATVDKNPMTKYVLNPNGSHNAFTVKIQFKSYTDADWKDFDASHYNNGSVTWNNDKYDASILFSRVNQAAHKFNAGYYRVTFTMPATDDYSEATDTRYFRVGKATLKITPSTGTTTYGESYAINPQGGHAIETPTGWKYDDTAALVDKSKFTWQVNYTAGDDANDSDSSNANKYLIRIDTTKTPAANQEIDNYTFDFQTAKLTVNKRSVTITIDGKSAYYKFMDGDVNEDNAGIENGYSVVSDTNFFVNSAGVSDSPIQIKTAAVTKQENGKYITANVGMYPIYAVWSDDRSRNNYTILFDNCEWKGTDAQLQIVVADDSPITSSNGAYVGTYEIKSVTLNPDLMEAELTVKYNGNRQPLTVYGKIGDNTYKDLTFTVSYKQLYDGDGNAVDDNGYITDAPKDAGRYEIKATYNPKAGESAENYIVTGLPNLPYTIQKADLKIYVANTTIQYGESLPQTEAQGQANKRFGGYTVTYTVPAGTYDLSADSANNTASITAKTLLEKENVGGDIKLILNLTFSSNNYTVNTPVTTGTTFCTFSITKDSYSAKNFNITVEGHPELRVLPREIGVKVKGHPSNVLAHNAYLGQMGDQIVAQQNYLQNLVDQDLAKNLTDSSFFTIVGADGQPLTDAWKGGSDDTLSDLAIKLNLDGKCRVGTHPMLPTSGAANYSITFYDATGNAYLNADKSINSAYKAEYSITPITVSVYAKGDPVTVTYGNNFTETDIENLIVFDGFVDGDSGLGDAAKLEANRKWKAVTNYQAWISGVSTTTYWVEYQNKDDADPLAFDDYIVSYVRKNISVVARSITASYVNKTYIYNNGAVDGSKVASGDPVHAEFTFGNITNAAYTPKLGTDYTLVYNGNSNVSPTVAATYSVTVQLVNPNYKWENDFVPTVAEHIVNPLTINVGWSPDASVTWKINAETQTGITRTIDTFNNKIMRVQDFVREYSGGQQDNLNIAGAERYTVGSDGIGITFDPYNLGSYRIRLTLNANAENNFVLSGNNQSGNSVLLILAVVSDVDLVNISVEMQGWEFGSYNADENVPKLTLQGGDVRNVTYSYALAGKSYQEIQTAGHISFKSEDLVSSGQTLNDFVGVSNFGAFSGAPLMNAGTYVVRALYGLTNQSAFYVYQVTPKDIDVPKFSLTVSGENQNNVYTGNQLTLNIALDNDAIAVDVLSCYLTTSLGGVALRTTDAGDYTIRYSLTSNNYVWNALEEGRTDVTEETVDGRSTYVAIWTVDKADGAITDITLPDRIVYGTGFTPSITAKFGAGTSYQFAVWQQGQTVENAENWDGTVQWVGSVIYADTYWIRVKSEVGPNYKAATAYKQFTIHPATLTVTPSGIMTYGDTMAVFTPQYDGYVALDSVRRPTPSGTLTYTVKKGEQVIASSDYATLDYGSYTLTVDVSGLTLANYTFVTTDGNLTVAQKRVLITVADRRSVYGDTIDLTTAGITVPAGIDIADLQLDIVLTGANMPVPDAGSYNIAVTAGNDNYIVSVASGVYTVTQRPIRINAITVSAGNVESVSDTVVSRLVDGNSTTVAFNAEDLIYTYRKVGDAVSYDHMPTNSNNRYDAGTYTVIVSLKQGTTFAQNYTLAANGYSFEVRKITLEVGKVTVNKPKYNGTVVIPKVTYENYSDETFATMFAVDYSEMVNAGVYSVTIRILNTDNFGWENTAEATRTIEFVVLQADNFVTEFSVADWTYGETAKDPKIGTTFDPDGSIDTYTYTYTTIDNQPIVGVPTQAGEYLVFVTITPKTNNYIYQPTRPDFARFTVHQAKLAAPTLVTVTEGEGKNDVYTGGTLSARIDGFNSTDMEMSHNALSVDVSPWRVQAVNAGTYTITIGLKDARNYAWESGADGNGNVVLTWVIAKKKVARPYNDGSKLIVNGKILTYTPAGFDADIMTIEGNQQGYGGTFTATVALKDPANYEWADGEDTLGEFPITWTVIGSNTVFAIVMGCLGGAAAIAAGVAVVLYFKYRKKKQSEAEAEAVA